MATLVGTALFGDGAAAVVAVGARRAKKIGAAGPEILGSRSHLYPDSQNTMGWSIGSSGFGLSFPRTCRPSSSEYLADDVTQFLAGYGLEIADVGAWVSHPGGPKVIEAIVRFARIARRRARTDLALAERGRQPLVVVSAARVARHDRQAATRGSPGVMLAMGPGFCSELVMLRWR